MWDSMHGSAQKVWKWKWKQNCPYLFGKPIDGPVDTPWTGLSTGRCTCTGCAWAFSFGKRTLWVDLSISLPDGEAAIGLPVGMYSNNGRPTHPRTRKPLGH